MPIKKSLGIWLLVLSGRVLFSFAFPFCTEICILPVENLMLIFTMFTPTPQFAKSDSRLRFRKNNLFPTTIRETLPTHRLRLASPGCSLLICTLMSHYRWKIMCLITFKFFVLPIQQFSGQVSVIRSVLLPSWFVLSYETTLI